MNQPPPGWGPQGYPPQQQPYPPPPYGYGPSPPQPPKRGPSAAVIILLLLIGLPMLTGGACAVCVCVGAASNRGTTSSSRGTSPASTSDLPERGEVGYLHWGVAGGTVAIYPSKDALDDSYDKGAKGTLARASATRVPAMTRARMVGGSFLYKEVEVAEGQHRGVRGWVPKEATHRRRP